MDQNLTQPALEAAADEPASPRDPAHDASPQPAFEPPPLLSDALAATLADRIPDAVEEMFPPGSRKPRHDGFTPEKIGDFLRHLAATGVVEHAAAAVGLSASAAYAFRNRPQGRAFAKMWDAILVHRTRARLASELQARAIAGCVSVRKRDGEVVGEYHYYDNRLAMSLLTRLDGLAEREAASDAHLRALSEDMEDFIGCIATGGDADAFVEARRPVEPEPPSPSVPGAVEARPGEEQDDDPELTAFAHLSACPDYLGVNPLDIPVTDLDPAVSSAWEPDQWVRAWRSGLMIWLHLAGEELDGFEPGPGSVMRFDFSRRAAAAAEALMPELAAGGEAQVDTADLDPARIEQWTDDQLARAWLSGRLERLSDDFWEDLAERQPVGREDI